MTRSARGKHTEQGVRLEACGSHAAHRHSSAQYPQLLENYTFIQEKEAEIPNTLTFVFIPKQGRKSLSSTGMDSLERIQSGNDDLFCSD